ncbi:hypothetical protein BWQ96_01804 [Gracilariopsis chorda]|uniref:Uncharacterized protein n=1 Tax=Gracilariopsis chorda TaxID=448386 RepID=A0A2V3J1S4_9FLOR|nr:hypothetical protein BWQ96_01804 [Gracilariopsis chorda]|eukprot:PXF48344.1 hypothetical protein BWQ96_01804 [Gracilariopsis chorda]
MDGLRERRRRTSPVPLRSLQNPSKQHPLTCLPCPTPSNLLITVQFLTIAYLLTRLGAQQAPSQHSTNIVLPIPAKENISQALTNYDFFITIYSYDRPRQLLHLLEDIDRESRRSQLRVGVNVIDDNSLSCVFPPVNDNLFDSHTSASLSLHLQQLIPNTTVPCSARYRFQNIETFLTSRGWTFYVSKYRHARRRYWHLVRMAHTLLHPISSRFYIFLPDDDRLATNFFHKLSQAWNSIEDTRKLTLMLHVEESRESTPVWTDFKPRNIGGGITRIGWVESGNFLCTHSFLRFMNWTFPRVGIQRWINNPPISSGVGSTLSELIHSSGHRMYRTQESFVAHIGVTLSKMNAQFRERNAPALLTKYFADGDHAYHQLLAQAATVTASIASLWTREAALHSAIHSLSTQVDHINVYLNGYDSVPSYLLAPHITVLRSQDKMSRGDIGDIGKFFWCNEIDTDFHLTADDDIIYPRSYVSSLLEFWKTFRSPVVVGVHGIRIRQEDLTPSQGGKGKGYYGSREVFMAVEQVREPQNVHIIGTGTLMYRPQDIGRIDIDQVFQEPNMADVWFGILAQNLQLPMIIIPHEADWIKEVPGTFDNSIYKRSTRSRTSDRLQTRAAKSVGTWKLHPPIPNRT